MLKIIPSCVDSSIIDELLSGVDYSLVKPFPYNDLIQTIHPIIFPSIFKIVKQYGNVVNVELLIYDVGSYMAPHTDEYAFEGDYNWKQTGILFLNEATDYEGGELILNELNTTLKCPKGTLVLFPAGPNTKPYTHSINTITSGKRLSLIFRFSSCG